LITLRFSACTACIFFSGVPNFLVHTWGFLAVVFRHSSNGENFAAVGVGQQTCRARTLPHLLPSLPARYALGVGERSGGWPASRWRTIPPLRVRPHQQLALSSSALPHEPISQVLSCEDHKGKSAAFASGDVVNVADATDIHSITEWHSLSPSSVIRIAIGASCDALSPCESDVDLPCSVGMTR